MLKAIVEKILGLKDKRISKSEHSEKVDTVSTIKFPSENKVEEVKMLYKDMMKAKCELEMFKIYRNGTVDVSKYQTVNADDKNIYIVFDHEMSRHFTVATPAGIKNRLVLSGYQNCTFTVPEDAEIYAYDSKRNVNLIPSKFWVKKECEYGLDVNLEIVMFKNLMYDQLQYELRKRGFIK